MWKPHHLWIIFREEPLDLHIYCSLPHNIRQLLRLFAVSWSLATFMRGAMSHLCQKWWAHHFQDHPSTRTRGFVGYFNRLFKYINHFLIVSELLVPKSCQSILESWSSMAKGYFCRVGLESCWNPKSPTWRCGTVAAARFPREISAESALVDSDDSDEFHGGIVDLNVVHCHKADP